MDITLRIYSLSNSTISIVLCLVYKHFRERHLNYVEKVRYLKTKR